ncbi:D-2-hydroxyacid dehydrogenase [Humisphaera borealis]|nr:D-2-hydroxyacid dehydrogenase [Humisphaera borealis]
MSTAPLTIYCNAAFPEPAMETLSAGLGNHQLLMPPLLQTSNLAAGGYDPLLANADVAFGQPDPKQVIETPRLKWVHLTTAGYTRYDTAELRSAMAARGGILTTSSQVYEEPCAEHVFSFMLALARQLPEMILEQKHERSNFRSWKQAHHRSNSRLLVGQSAMIYGYGTIARRLTELLAPFHMKLIGVRRKIAGDEGIMMVPTDQADAHLGQADHVINILPAAAGTDRYFNAERFMRMKQGSVFYNIGRGNTVDQVAMIAALKSGQVSAAYLDVTDPEPLPRDHPLWDAPNCWITPHTAGGHTDEFARLVKHFVANLDRYLLGEKLADRVI